MSAIVPVEKCEGGRASVRAIVTVKTHMFCLGRSARPLATVVVR